MQKLSKYPEQYFHPHIRGFYRIRRNYLEIIHLYTNRIPDHGGFSMIHEKRSKLKESIFDLDVSKIQQRCPATKNPNILFAAKYEFIGFTEQAKLHFNS